MDNYNGRFRLPKKAGNPFKRGYDPLLDIIPELELDEVDLISNCYQHSQMDD